MSVVLQMLKLISDKLLKDEESDTRLTKDIKKRIREDLDSQYDGVPERITGILKAAMFLDPRFKTNYIKGSIGKIPHDQSDYCWGGSVCVRMHQADVGR